MPDNLVGAVDQTAAEEEMRGEGEKGKGAVVNQLVRIRTIKQNRQPLFFCEFI